MSPVFIAGAYGNLLPRREVLKLEDQGEVVGAIARIDSLLRSQAGEWSTDCPCMDTAILGAMDPLATRPCGCLEPGTL